MGKRWVKFASLLCASALLLAGLTGCGIASGGGGQEKVRLMVWSPSEDQSKDSGQ